MYFTITYSQVTDQKPPENKMMGAYGAAIDVFVM